MPDLPDWTAVAVQATLELAEKGLVLATIQRSTALLRTDAGWSTAGVGRVRVFVAGEEKGLEALPAI